MQSITDWAIRHSVTPSAMAELRVIMLGATPDTPVRDGIGTSEAAVQVRTRVAVSRMGWRCWRNNIGAGKLENGVFLRWGLANDSHSMNQSLKSGDLIGIRPLLITAPMVGCAVGQFVSLECKPVGWKWSGTERELAQQKWAHQIIALGGHARFVTDERDVK